MDWTETPSKKKGKVIKKKDGMDDYEQRALMKEMQGFKNWTEKEEKKVIPANTGRSKMGAGLTCEAFIREDFQERKREKVNSTLANAVKKARTDSLLTQEELAKACSVKTYEISGIENGTAYYDPNLINMIERYTGIKLERGRDKDHGKKKRKKRKKENEVWQEGD